MGEPDRHFGSSSSVFRPNTFVSATSNDENVPAKNGTAGTKMAVELTCGSSINDQIYEKHLELPNQFAVEKFVEQVTSDVAALALQLEKISSL